GQPAPAHSRRRAPHPRRAADADDGIRGDGLRPPPHDQARTRRPKRKPAVTAAHQPSREQERKRSEMRHLATPGSLESPETLRRENDQLRTALVTRIIIEQAKGMLAERLAIEVDDAFERLRREARNRRMKL